MFDIVFGRHDVWTFRCCSHRRLAAIAASRHNCLPSFRKGCISIA